jgi:hypothetical protein
MAAGGVTVQDRPQEELDRRDRREQAITPSGVARLLSHGLEGVRLGLNRPMLRYTLPRFTVIQLGADLLAERRGVEKAQDVDRFHQLAQVGERFS